MIPGKFIVIITVFVAPWLEILQKISLVFPSMNAFSIRDIENICGIKAHTLRIWEQRYQLLCPKRKAGNHRMYDNNDLKCLLRIAFLYHNGHKISAIAKLNQQEIADLALSLASAGDYTDVFINQLTEAAMDFDQEQFDKVLHNVILHLGFERTITRVAYPFLNRIGLLWLTGNVVPAQEHFASALISKRIHVAINGLENPLRPGNLPGAGQKNVLIYTPKGEFHEIPILYMRYLMKKNGIPTIYFGKDIALEELVFYCRQQPVTHLYFHLVTQLLRCEPDRYVKQLYELFPDKQIVISGGMGAHLKDMKLPPTVRRLESLEEMLNFAAER